MLDLSMTFTQQEAVVRTTQPIKANLGLGDFIQWDVRNWSVALDCWRQYCSQDLSSCKALEIGSHTGGLSLWMALHGARVTCSDLAGPPESAIQKHREYGVSRLVTY